MAGFLYFLPDADQEKLTGDPQILVSCGLGDALAEFVVDWKPANNILLIPLRGKTPSGQPGILVYPIPLNDSMPRTTGYNPAEQEWMDAGGYWLGIDKQDRPTPDDLVRAVMLTGHPRTLLDRNEWSVPIVRTPIPSEETWRTGQGRSHLPTGFRLAPGGGMAVEQLPEYRKIWELSARAWDLIAPGERPPFDPQEACQLAATFLGVNYRIGLSESLMLGLFTSRNLVSILMAVCNWDTVEEVLGSQKKSDSAAESVNTSPGEREHSPDTDPAAPTSSSSAMDTETPNQRPSLASQ